jgi:hypothetical protein
MKNPFRNKEEFLAALLRLHPELRVEVLPSGGKIIHGIRLKTDAELKADAKKRGRIKRQVA